MSKEITMSSVQEEAALVVKYRLFGFVVYTKVISVHALHHGLVSQVAS